MRIGKTRKRGTENESCAVDAIEATSSRRVRREARKRNKMRENALQPSKPTTLLQRLLCYCCVFKYSTVHLLYIHIMYCIYTIASYHIYLSIYNNYAHVLFNTKKEETFVLETLPS